MKPRDSANPTNRFHSQSVEYDDGEAPPPSNITLIEDHSRSILSENDSPDVGFRWSANPYRGCVSACAYCLSGDTQILMGDGRTRRLVDIKVGDEIYGTLVKGTRRRFTATRVLNHWGTVKPAYRVVLVDGTELIASGDHRFLTGRGWSYVAPDDASPQRPCLTTTSFLVGPGRSNAFPSSSLPRRTEFLSQMTAGLAISRKWGLEGVAITSRSDLRVASIEPLGVRQLFDITTGTGDFIANGVVSHNCYARPTHEYLDMGAGTDFDTKIVVKRQAPELLRATFDKPSWKGELVMFSGVTDCYQPFERELELTKKCLEVCLEYKNPVSVISKHALVERDIELFLALAQEARFFLNVSLAFTDNELSRSIEPWAASPDRRFKVIERMAKAGVPVGVMIAPVIPGVNDNQLVKVLERAAEAGATQAGWVLLRLPGAVKQVFEERIRVALPLAADKIMNRIRDTRGGEKLYNSKFGTRGRGEGAYAETIATMFDTTVARLGLNQRKRHKDDDVEDAGLPTTFQRPPKRTNQLTLF